MSYNITLFLLFILQQNLIYFVYLDIILHLYVHFGAKDCLYHDHNQKCYFICIIFILLQLFLSG